MTVAVSHHTTNNGMVCTVLGRTLVAHIIPFTKIDYTQRYLKWQSVFEAKSSGQSKVSGMMKMFCYCDKAISRYSSYATRDNLSTLWHWSETMWMRQWACIKKEWNTNKNETNNKKNEIEDIEEASKQWADDDDGHPTIFIRTQTAVGSDRQATHILFAHRGAHQRIDRFCRLPIWTLDEYVFCLYSNWIIEQ